METLTACALRAEKLQTWSQLLCGKRAAPVYPHNRFAPAFELDNHRDRKLAVRWHLSTFPLPYDARSRARNAQEKDTLSLLSQPNPSAQSLVLLTASIGRIREAGELAERSAQPSPAL